MIDGLSANVFVANHDTERVGSFRAKRFWRLTSYCRMNRPFVLIRH
jgi:hypothetical protein